MRKILIAIQARSASTRLPNKIHLQINGKSILQTVIDTCSSAMKYVQKDAQKLNAEVSCVLLVPKGDPVVSVFQNQIPIFEGSQDDVLSRYVMAQKECDADYVVRITSDCYFLQPHLISKHIKSALIKERDYTTNCIIRTFKEGMDIQIVSRRLLDWIDKNAKDSFDREHVCSILHTQKPFPFRDVDGKPSICHVLNVYDESSEKTSIDTPDEFNKAKQIAEMFRKSKDLARRTGIFVT